MARINIDIPDDMHASAKIQAIKAKMKLKDYYVSIIEAGLIELN